MRMKTMTIKYALEVLEKNYNEARKNWVQDSNEEQWEQMAALGAAIDQLKTLQCKNKHKTNFDVEVQQLTIEELASLKSVLYSVTFNLCQDCPIMQFCKDRYNSLPDIESEDCYEVWLAWLKQKAVVNEDS